MSTTFSLHNGPPGLHWFPSKPFGTDQINAIRDPQGGQTEQQPTSIPSPFARMDLVRSAFLNLAQNPQLAGTMNDLRVVSDALDVGELFFNQDKLKTLLTISGWSVQTDLAALSGSAPGSGRRRLGEALKLFLEQDSSTYNFSEIQRLFILSYRGRVVGGTSPKTLFFSSGNDLTWVDVVLGNHRLFDPQSPLPLFRRDIDYQKYWYGLQAFMPRFRERFRELDEYLTRSKTLLQQTDPTLFHQHIQTQNGQLLVTPESLLTDFEELTTGPGDVVEVLGYTLRKKKSDADRIGKVSDFIIKSDKYSRLNPSALRPMVLQNRFYRDFMYVPQGKWDPSTPIPYYAPESWQNNERPLPGQPGNYPWLTVSDLLEPYLIRLPYALNRVRFFDGNLATPDTDKGYLLPLKPAFFDFFDVADVQNQNVRLRMEPRAGGGINVTLDIPVTAPTQAGNQYITLERLYAPALNNFGVAVPDLAKNEGIIIEDSFTINIYPFVRSGRAAIPADYRVQLIESGYGKRNQYALTYMQQANNAAVAPESRHVRTERQQNTDGSSSYDVLRQEFDYVQASVKIEGHDLRGLLIPRWQTVDGGSKRFAFSVDFGTTNTHIEYSVDNGTPKPFDIPDSLRQVGTLVAPAQYNGALFELFALYDLEFVPPTIGPGQPDSFPTRTVVAESPNLDFNQLTQSLADFNIPFYYERQSAGTNRTTGNLKWARHNAETDRRTKAFLEELMLLIKNKVLLEGGNLAATTIYWFYPASMSRGRIAELSNDWKELYARYIDGQTAQPKLFNVSESVAPFYYYKQIPTLSASARPVVNIDIGGGTSDVVIYERNQPRLLTSFRFAGNAIYGDAFSQFGAASNNGFVRKYNERIRNLLATQNLSKLSDNNQKMLDGNRSDDIVAFWFSIEKSDEVKAKDMLSFNRMLAKDDDLKIVFVLFYVALLYHVAKLMKLKQIGLPGAITFSGTGSKVLNIISADDSVLADLGMAVFEEVFKQPFDSSGLTVYSERKGPKEVTCKGALMMGPGVQSVSTDRITYVYPATFEDKFETLSYADLSRPEVTESLLQETRAFVDFFFALNQKFSFVRNLNVSATAMSKARQELQTHLDTFLMSGIQQKMTDVSAEVGGMDNALTESVEETLFFYPLIGAINKLANALA